MRNSSFKPKAIGDFRGAGQRAAAARSRPGLGLTRRLAGCFADYRSPERYELTVLDQVVGGVPGDAALHEPPPGGGEGTNSNSSVRKAALRGMVRVRPRRSSPQIPQKPHAGSPGSSVNTGFAALTAAETGPRAAGCYHLTRSSRRTPRSSSPEPSLRSASTSGARPGLNAKRVPKRQRRAPPSS